ncbi:MAG: hypothetical protein ACYC2H_01335 [Thermoplasmatota archaeon]
MGEQDNDNDFGKAPDVATSGDWNIVDGGMEREGSDSLASTLAADNETKDDAAETPGNEEASGDGSGTEEPVVEATAKPAAEPEKKQRPIERRVGELKAEINALSGQRHRTRAEATAAREELDQLKRDLVAAKAELATLKKGAEPSGGDRDTEGGSKKTAAGDGALKKPVWKEFDEADKTWDEFLDAQDAYFEAKIEATTGKAQAAFQAELDKLRQDADSQAHETRVNTEHRARLTVARAAHADFNDAISNLKDVDQTPFMADVVRMHSDGAELLYQLGKHPEEAAILTSLDFTTTMFNAVMESKNPASVLLTLASDPDEFARIRSMPPAQAMFALGALDARHAQSASGTRERPATKGASVSNAPAPIRPVGSGGKAPAADDNADDDDIPFEKWHARETARDAKKSRMGAY